MNVVWDLDGVLRDLNGHLMHLYGGEYPTEWNFKYGNGKTIYECIDENLAILVEAPPTAYLRTCLQHYNSPEIWTSQPEPWQPLTKHWIKQHIGEGCTIRFLRCEEKEEELRKDESILLVEDTPNFKSYDRVLLIDRPYNQTVKGAVRIFGTKHLNNMLEITKGV